MKPKDEFPQVEDRGLVFSNEDIAEALGWSLCNCHRYFLSHYIMPSGKEWPMDLPPDFKNDMNAATEQVWPAIVSELWEKIGKWEGTLGEWQRDILFHAYNSPNKALALCEAFWKLHGEK